MKLSKPLMTAGIITAVAAGSIAGVNIVNAQSDGEQSSRRDALIDRLAQDTGADRATIEGSFEALREERMAEMAERKAAHLDSLVEDDTLTQEQRDALEAKFEEMRSAKEALRDQDLTREEMREQFSALKDEMQAWAEEQGIDLEAIRPDKGDGFGRKGHRGFGPRFHSDGDTDDADIESSDIDVEES